ncbi:DUF4192 family protein [Leucobacter sp. USHLN153]|uniref:DUF4192 family protein n=1 Tax=Leucobacter sp. USHLN153 TaxID=3081268 RepID=UPI0030191A1C
MTHTLHDPRPVVRCTTTADFLAALPRLTGFTACNSIFVVCFSGSRSGQAVRIDLPETEEPQDSRAILDFISELASDIESSSGLPCALAIVISTDDTFSALGDAPWRRLARRIERRLRRDRVAVRELCVLAADGWVSFLDPRAPRSGRPLSEISASPIAADLEQLGPRPEPLASLGAIPEVDAQRAAEVAAAFAGFAAPDFPAPESDPPLSPGAGNLAHRALAWMKDTAEVTRTLLGEEDLDALCIAELIRCTTDSDRWLVLAMGVLTRPDFPVELGHEHPLGNFIGVPIDLDLDRGLGTARSTQELREMTAAAGWAATCAHGPVDTDGVCRRGMHSPPPGWSIYRLLASICPEFTEHARLPPLQRRLLDALSACPREHRPGLLAFSSWLWWLSGTQTVAQRQLDAALEIDEAHEMSLMLRRLTDQPLYERLIAGLPPSTRSLPHPAADAA